MAIGVDRWGEKGGRSAKDVHERHNDGEAEEPDDLERDVSCGLEKPGNLDRDRAAVL